MRGPVRRAAVLPVGAGLAVAAALLLIGTVTDSSASCPRTASAHTSGTGAAARTVAVTSASGATVAAPRARRPALVLTWTDLDGNPISLAAFRGEVVVLNVWGSWCAPCRAEADDLALLSGEVRGAGVRFLGINTRDRDRDAARSFVRAHGLDFPSLHDPTGALLLRFPPEVLNPQTIPSTLVVDREGRVAVAIGGAVSAGRLKPLIDRVAAEG
ncbi:Thiol-disulfide oxidoreductase ResA [Streptomyces lavendulae subsp. lavendulae]|uniref:Thiol-disulfide oxidoreductase ResA n=1 Tax=Streptomyces lavendulae subsp. lavendulae TaxID=58340 RepID=A0A2K8P704_STRLA|nr:TlpA disulfide reductase family protein [Streptomyces lavendulae]ATZ22248.1 Thiol-disulfide oxidoreductase ResA [Streptomyces lavendulae subsp. lavendulae]